MSNVTCHFKGNTNRERSESYATMSSVTIPDTIRRALFAVGLLRLPGLTSYPLGGFVTKR